jgi:putative MFS transporter
MDTKPISRVTAAARLDRLPIMSVHRTVMWLLGFCFFFELGDINTFAFAAPAIRAQWNVPIETIRNVTSATFIGMFIGAATGGRIADSIGRKRALVLATLWFSAFSLLNAIVWEPYGLFFARLLTGIGLSAMTAIGITYVAEMFPARARGTYQGWVMFIGLCGIPAAAIVALIVIPMFPSGWRFVFLWGSIGLIFPFLATKLEESPRWHERRGRFAEADAILARMERKAEEELRTILPAPEASNTVPRDGKFSELFAAQTRSRTFMLMAAWAFQTLGFYGFSAWVPTLLVERGFPLVESLAWTTSMQLLAPFGALLAAYVSDKFDRKWSITVVALLTAASGFAYGASFEVFGIVLFGGLMILFFQCFAPMLYAYTAECFPTEIRSTGTGFTYGMGRLSNAVGPFIVAYLFTQYGYQSVFVYIGLCWILVAVAIGFVGPKTKGHQL